mmetsp:Transcript_25635/g.39410  ORF Transcript_25635/g.39410 Transcript_25635/m.39410 type:complete len:324 (+) Transcript_25635:176-1147(+)
MSSLLLFNRQSDQWIGRFQLLVVFQRLLHKGFGAELVFGRSGKEFHQRAGHNVRVLCHQQCGPVTRVFGREPPVLQQRVDLSAHDWQSTEGRRCKVSERQVKSVLALEVSEFVSKHGLNFPRGASIHQSRCDDNHGGRIRVVLLVVASFVAAGLGLDCERVGVGLRIGLDVELGSKIRRKIENLAGFDQELVQLWKLLRRNLDRGRHEIQSNALFDEGKSPTESVFGKSVKGSISNQSGQSLIEGMPELTAFQFRDCHGSCFILKVVIIGFHCFVQPCEHAAMTLSTRSEWALEGFGSGQPTKNRQENGYNSPLRGSRNHDGW